MFNMSENLIAAEKADYYQKTLQYERTNREQTDRQVINLLSDIRNRYDIKLEGYMAKNKSKNNAERAQGDDRGASKNNKKDEQSNGWGTGGWGADDTSKVEDSTAWDNNEADNEKTAQGDGWNNAADNEESAQGGWGNESENKQDANNSGKKTNSPNKPETEKNTKKKSKNKADRAQANDSGASMNNKKDEQSNGWGTGGWGADDTSKVEDSTAWDNNEANNENSTQGDGWNNAADNEKSAQGGWGNESESREDANNASKKTDSPDKPDTDKTNKKKSKNNKGAQGDDRGASKSNKKDEQSNDRANKGWDCDDTSKAGGATTWGSKEAGKEKSSQGGWGNKPENKEDNKSASQKPEPPKKPETVKAAAHKTDTSDDKLDVSHKEFLEMKSQLWTAKLDLRLAERDKAKFADELAAIKEERDNLQKKLSHAGEEKGILGVRVKGLAIDLIGANEEIQKLNLRIDEMEAEKKREERDAHAGENKRRSLENKYKTYQQQIVELQSELSLLKEEKEESDKKALDLSRRNDRLEADLRHSKNLIRTLKDGCTYVENQAKNFEVRHDTIVMSKADMERELIAIKEESSRHITTINKLQKSNQQISNAFIQSVEAHEQCRKETDFLRDEYSRRLEDYKLENLKLVEANGQLRKLIDYMQKKR